MERNENLISLIIYDEHLITINGIKFTHREIDVMAFIFHTRGSGKIASLLSISSRTVETHTANIMRKMDTNSREGIIDFIEKKDHAARIKKHYQALMLQINFNKKLQDISLLIKGKNLNCAVLLDCSHKKEEYIIDAIKKHLTLCGLTILTTGGNESSLPSLRNEKGAFSQQHFICLLNAEFIEHFQVGKKSDLNLVSKFIPEPFQNTQAHTFICYNGPSENPPTENIKDEIVCFKDLDEYYFLFFILLKRILAPNINIEPIIETFKNSYDHLIDTSIKSNLESNIPSKKPSYLGFFTNKYNLRVTLATAAIAIICIAYRLSFIDKPPSTNMDHKHSRSIRSDLVVPAGSTYLNRPNIMAKINESLKGNDGIQAVALVGIAGAGKTTIAQICSSTKF